ncbi:hypothetical protein LCM4573_14805 [Rhizobium sp. LCM 4573]|nr:EAL domain-containing protein [Rhizobium sp. LCM 4573]OHV75925.1 hypothetical protein LCM4573_14805 [Rhizobium sp. LCM 4573]
MVRLSPLGKIRHAARGIRISAAAAMLLVLGVILTGVVLDRQHTESFREELYGRTEKAATFLSGRLATRLDKDVWLANHLAQAFTGEAGGSLTRFRHVAEEEIAGTPHFLAIALAPNLELTAVFTRQSLGLDAHGLGVDAELLGEQVKSFRQDGAAVLLSNARNGHLTLFVPFGEPGQGSIAVVMDQAGLIEATGVSLAPTGSSSGALADLSWMDVAIRDMGREGGPVIFGEASIQAPRAWPLAVNGASWEILAAPKAGWNAVPPDQTIIRLSIALAALGMIVPIIVASLLIDERNRNIAALKAREANLLQLSQRFHLAMESSNIGIWEVTDDHRLYWDERAAALHGRQAEARGSRLEDWLASIFPEDQAAAEAHFFIATCSGSPCSDIYRVRLEDGALRYLRSAGASYLNADGSRRTTGIVWDITADMVMTETLRAAKETSDIKNAELELALDELSNREQELELAKSRIEYNALHDPLTELANRRKLDLELDRLSRASQTERQKFSILHLDLDRFKQINDTLGHAAGDAMLVHAARVLSRNVGSGDLVARIGGDEFVIFVNGNCNAEQMADLASGIIMELRQPIDFEGFSCRGGVSIGIAQASGFNLDARRTLVNADIALYRAKAMGRNRHEFFTQNLQAEIISHKRTADEVLAGIDNHEFVTWYQPQFDARSNELTGVEALVRWNHPHHGILAPDRFLKIAEDLNVAATLDQIVLETVLKDRMRWAALGIGIPKVSVNVSSRRLHDEGLIDSLKGLAIAPGQVSFELVESIFLDESEAAAASNLERIKSLGIDIEIDDFGTGHTSIVSLLKLKPKRLKIDRQLVMPILTSPQERALVRSIIDIARSLGVETVAEGVETMQHAALLRELDCDLLQGYAFSRPLSFDDFTRSALAGWRKAAA